MGIEVRKAKRSERKTLTDIAFNSKAYWGYSSEFMDSCRDELEVSEEKILSKSFSYFVAELSDRLIGFYALERHSNDDVELEALFVEPGSIGKGIGRRLIEHAKKEAKDSGYRELVIQGDPNALKFYLKAGAEYVGEKESGSIHGRMLPLFRIYLKED